MCIGLRSTRAIFLLAGIALFVYLFVRLGPGAVLGMLGRIGWGAVPIAAAYLAYQCMRALALRASVPSTPQLSGGFRLQAEEDSPRQLSGGFRLQAEEDSPRQLSGGFRLQAEEGRRTLSFRDALWIRLSGEAVQFLTFTGPFLAEPAKAWLLKSRGLTAVEGFAATLTEYLSYTITAAVLSIGALWWLLAHGMMTGGVRIATIVLLGFMAAFLVSAAIAISLRVHLLGAILERIAGLPLVRRRLKPDMVAVHRVEDLLLDVMHDRPSRFARILLLESASHALHIVELYLILVALELGAGAGTAVLIEGAAKFVGLAFFFIPGQVGASEGAHTIIFEIVGLPAVAGFTVPFVRRIRSIVVAGIGLLGISLLTRTRPAR